MRPLLSFVAIVKNEAANIRKTLESVKPFVDYWTVLDTGSTDATPDIIREVMSGVPGRIYFEPFVDFAVSRNRAIDLDDSRAVFTLMLSGDEVLTGGVELRAFLEEHRDGDACDGAYTVEMQSGVRRWPYTRVLRADNRWRYLGAVHERPVSPRGEVAGPAIPGVSVVFTESDPTRKVSRLRDLDLPLLTKEVEDESKSLEERAHSIFFLAETYALLAAQCPTAGDGKPVPGGPWMSLQLAAMGMYFRYATIAEDAGPAHDNHKAMYAYFMYLHLADQASMYTSEELITRLKLVTEAAPKLAEAHFLLANHSIQLGLPEGLDLAVKAAEVARQVKETPTHEVADQRIEWMAWTLAADCAREKQNMTLCRDYVAKAVAAGAPKEMFGGLA